MPNTRDIRRRIKSVKNTAQITKAMQLVAASKMKKAQDQATSGRPYADLMNKVLVNLKDQSEDGSHPLLQERGEEGKELMLVLGTDKGLCGPLNTNLLRDVASATTEDTIFVTVGVKARQYIARTKRDLLADFSVKDPVSFAESKVISKFVMEQFLDGKVSRVRVAFTNFVNTLSQYPMIETLLPIRPIDLGRDKDFVGMGAKKDGEAVELASTENAGSGYIFEPDAEVVLDQIVPQYVNYQVYQMVLESRASEHSARMVAMKSATDNAKQLIKDLTLEYNKIRQASITNELLEITTAMRALE